MPGHAAMPRGSTTRLHGLDTYVSEPADGRSIRGVVVIVSDAYGWEFENTRLLADRYADKGGYRVLLPDFFKGHACPTWMIDSLRVMMGSGNIISKAYAAFWVAYAFIPFVVSQQLAGDGYSTVATYVSAVRDGPEATRGLPVFAAGFSWGARRVLQLAAGSEGAGGRPLVDAVFIGHPSHLHVPRDVECAAVPVSFALGDHDHGLSGDKVVELERMLSGAAGEQHQCRGEVRLYRGVGNGFCVRADVTTAEADKQADEAEQQAIEWFGARTK